VTLQGEKKKEKKKKKNNPRNNNTLYYFAMFICPLPFLVLFCHQGLNDRHWNSSRLPQWFLPFFAKLQIERFKGVLNIFFV